MTCVLPTPPGDDYAIRATIPITEPLPSACAQDARGYFILDPFTFPVFVALSTQAVVQKWCSHPPINSVPPSHVPHGISALLSLANQASAVYPPLEHRRRRIGSPGKPRRNQGASNRLSPTDALTACRQPVTGTPSDATMGEAMGNVQKPKSKRPRSLQAILIPSFLRHVFSSTSSTSTPKAVNPSTSGARTRSSLSLPLPSHSTTTRKLLSSRRPPSRKASPPPVYLQDDDPFADRSVVFSGAVSPDFSRPQSPASTTQSFWPLEPSRISSNFASSSVSLPGNFASSPSLFSVETSALSLFSTLSVLDTVAEGTPPDSTTPRLQNTAILDETTPPATPMPSNIRTAGLVRQSSSSAIRVRPAYEKPALTPRPSLPSLNSLSKMSVVTPKARRGKVGAGLPSEPWGLGSASNAHERRTQHRSLDLDGVLYNPPPYDGVEDSDAANVSPRIDYIVPDPEADAAEIPVVNANSCYPGRRQVRSVQLDDILESEDECGLSFGSLSASDSSFPEPLTPLRPPSALRWSLDHLRETGRTHASEPAAPSLGSDDHSVRKSIDTLNKPQLGHRSYPFSRPPSESPTDLNQGSASKHPLFDIESLSQATSYSLNMRLEDRDPCYDLSGSPSTIREAQRAPSPSAVSNTLSHGAAGGGSSHQGGTNEQSRGETNYSGNGAERSTSGRVNGSNGYPSRQGGQRNGGRDDDDDDDDRRYRGTNMSAFSSPSDSEEPTSDDERLSGDEDEMGRRGGLRTTSNRPPLSSGTPRSGRRSSTDDDVPLARRIPTALHAQQTIRRQVRDEREARRRERERQPGEGRSYRTREPARSPPRAVDSSGQRLRAESNPEMRLSSSLPRRPKRSIDRPFAAEDLTQKLLNVQASDSLPSAVSSRRPTAAIPTPSRPSGEIRTIGARVAEPRFHEAVDNRGAQEGTYMRRAEGQPLEGLSTVPLPVSGGPALSRAGTGGNSRGRSDIAPRRPGTAESNVSLAESSATRARSTDDRVRVRAKSVTSPPSARTSGEMGSTATPPQRSQRSPVPPLPTSLLPLSPPKNATILQRIFVGNRERFNMVEITSTTSAQDVLDTIANQGQLDNLPESGGPMVWEVAQDFGMERPVRSYERLSDISASWNKDKLVNMFVIKKTLLSVPLSRSAIPSSAPTFRGYVEWESKRGKWSKRWMQLREQSLWLSKRDTGKDEVFLCSLSNFDGYFIICKYKAPKPFKFAVKSTESLSLFENAADYVHVFSCGEKEGQEWMRNILLARCYVLHQERNILFSKPGNANVGSTKGVAGTETRKVSRPTQRPVPFSQPLGNVTKNVFEPGSLLARRATDIRSPLPT